MGKEDDIVNATLCNSTLFNYYDNKWCEVRVTSDKNIEIYIDNNWVKLKEVDIEEFTNKEIINDR